MTVIAVPYHLDEYLPDLDLPLEAAEVVTTEFPPGGPWERLAVLYDAVARAVAATVLANTGRSGGHPVVLTGDCLISLGIVAGLQHAGADPAIVWFDAHGDVQTPETTASGYLGGMPLRLLAGYRPELIAARLGLRPVPEHRIVLAGARDLDPPEATYLASAAIRRREVIGLTTADLPAGPLYVHVDLDVIDAAGLPGLRYPVPGGPDAARLADSLRTLLATGRVAALGVACTWRPGHASARYVAAQLSAVLEYPPSALPSRASPRASPRPAPGQRPRLRRVRAHQAQRDGAVRPAGLEPGPRRIEPLRRDPAELPGRPADGRFGVRRPEPPDLRAVRRGQLAPHRGGLLARQAQRVRQRAVRQPGDVPEPGGVGEVGAERFRYVKTVRPVLGQPGRRQRGRLDRADHPLHGCVRVGAPHRGQRGLPGPLPPGEHLGRSGRRHRPFRPDRGVGSLVHRLPGHRVQRPPQVAVRGRGRGRLLRLGQMQHHIGDRPALRPRSRLPLPLVQPAQDLLQPLLLRRQVIEDGHPRTMTHRLPDPAHVSPAVNWPCRVAMSEQIHSSAILPSAMR